MLQMLGFYFYQILLEHDTYYTLYTVTPYTETQHIILYVLACV